MKKLLLIGTLCAAMAFAGCTSDVPGISGPDEDVPSGQRAPDEETLCEIVFGESSRGAVETVLGQTDARESPLSTNLLYQYSNGLTLSLLFRNDVFVDATVYNGVYPGCWAEEERQQAEEAVERAKKLEAQDAGI